MNITSGTKNEPEAVLLKALEPLEGFEEIRKNRGNNQKLKIKDFSNGPGKLTQALGIDKDFNGFDLCNGNSELYIVDFENY